jgi:hypothetical protein
MLYMAGNGGGTPQNFPFSIPSARLNQRQIALSGQRARALVIDDSRANAEALAVSLSTKPSTFIKDDG